MPLFILCDVIQKTEQYCVQETLQLEWENTVIGHNTTADTFLKSEFLFLTLSLFQVKERHTLCFLTSEKITWLEFFEESRTNGAKKKLEGRGRTFSDTKKRWSPNWKKERSVDVYIQRWRAIHCSLTQQDLRGKGQWHRLCGQMPYTRRVPLEPQRSGRKSRKDWEDKGNRSSVSTEGEKLI